MKRITSLDEYQKIAMRTLYQFISKKRQLEYAVIALCGEAGELANVTKKIVFYEKTSVVKIDIIDELSDVLWYVACVADSLDVRLSDVATFNIDKIIAKRDTKKKERERGVRMGFYVGETYVHRRKETLADNTPEKLDWMTGEKDLND